MQATQTTQTVQQFIANVTDEGFYFGLDVNAVFTTAGDGYWSSVSKDVYVTGIGMYISTEQDDGFCDGDLAVCYTEATWDNKVHGLIYTDSAFIAQVQQYLIAQGFDAAAVNSISYSEQGMQDNERVSCDAYEFADYIRRLSNAAITTVVS